jgi:hypothetical protein
MFSFVYFFVLLIDVETMFYGFVIAEEVRWSFCGFVLFSTEQMTNESGNKQSLLIRSNFPHIGRTNEEDYYKLTSILLVPLLSHFYFIIYNVINNSRYVHNM